MCSVRGLTLWCRATWRDTHRCPIFHYLYFELVPLTLHYREFLKKENAAQWEKIREQHGIGLHIRGTFMGDSVFLAPPESFPVQGNICYACYSAIPQHIKLCIFGRIKIFKIFSSLDTPHKQPKTRKKGH